MAAETAKATTTPVFDHERNVERGPWGPVLQRLTERNQLGGDPPQASQALRHSVRCEFIDFVSAFSCSQTKPIRLLVRLGVVWRSIARRTSLFLLLHTASQSDAIEQNWRNAGPQLTGTGRIMRAVGRNMRRGRVANILEKIEWGYSSEGQGVVRRPFGCFLELLRERSRSSIWGNNSEGSSAAWNPTTAPFGQ